MRRSVWAKVAIGIFVLAVAFTLVSGQVYQAYAYRSHYHSHYRRVGFYSYYYYPYYSYYYPYYSYPYCNSSYTGYYGWYPYSYVYGYGNCGYGQQYQLTLNTSPSSLSNAVTGGGQYVAGSSASFSASQNIIQVSQGTRYIFSQWTGDYSGSGSTGSVTMDSAKSVTAVYQLQYYLSVSTQPSNAPQLQGGGWYNASTSAVILVPSQVVPVNSGSQLAFSGWTVDENTTQTGSTLTIQMNGPHTVVAQYSQQYYLTVSGNQGSVSGGGWYDAGSYAQISASPPPSPSYGVSMVFNGWQGDIQSSSQSTTVLMDSPKSVTATWGTDPTVLYVTIALMLAAVAVVSFIGAVAWSRRKKTQLQTQTQ